MALATIEQQTNGTVDLVGVSESAQTNDTKRTLMTDTIGSCVALSLFDPVARVGGLLHFMLPSAGERQEPMEQAMYADTGVPMLLNRLQSMGATEQNLVACAAGGAEMLNDDQSLGSANRSSLAQVLQLHNIQLAAEDTGGNSCRTLSLSIETGETTVRNNGKERVIWQA